MLNPIRKTLFGVSVLGALCLATQVQAQAVIAGPIVNPSNGHSYYLLEPATWTASEAKAITLGGHLATVRNQAENDWIYAQFGNFSHGGKTARGLWIGLNDAATESDFDWSSSEAVGYTNWGTGEPNNLNGSEDHVHLLWPGEARQSRWNDLADGDNYFGIPLSGVVEVLPSSDGGDGKIEIIKKVDGNPAQIADAGPFVVQVRCKPAASQRSVSLSAPGFSQTMNIPPGATCSIQEVPPKAPRGCRWITTYPNGQSGKDGDTLIVQNQLSCREDPPKGGKITIVKKIGGDLSSLAAPGPFDVQVKCDPAASQQTVSLSAPGFSHVLAVAQGAKCEIREVTPKAPEGCRWITTYPSGQAGKDGDTLVVQNELSCGPPPPKCPRGQTPTTFPGSDVTYCCNGKPGNDKFCCSRARDPRTR